MQRRLTTEERSRQGPQAPRYAFEEAKGADEQSYWVKEHVVQSTIDDVVMIDS